MLKIDRRFRSDFSTISGSPSSQTSTTKSVEPSLFEQHFQSKVESQIQSELKDLLDDMDNKGKRFSFCPSMENLMQYKNALKRFLQVVTKNSFHIKELYGRRIDFKIVNVINSKLEELTRDVIHQEIPRMVLLAKLEEIRGLIIDLVF